MKIREIEINLTEEQFAQLAPFTELFERSASVESPDAIFAQVTLLGDDEQGNTATAAKLRVWYLPYPACKTIDEALQSVSESLPYISDGKAIHESAHS